MHESNSIGGSNVNAVNAKSVCTCNSSSRTTWLYACMAPFGLLWPAYRMSAGSPTLDLPALELPVSTVHVFMILQDTVSPTWLQFVLGCVARMCA